VDASPSLTALLLEAFRSMDREIAAALADRGIGELRPSEAKALILVERGTGTRLTDLSVRAGITKQAMMQVVDQLQGKGLVRRTADPADARAKTVKLTAKGLRERAEARRALTSVEARLHRRLGDRRYDILRSILGELTELPE
jgi:DNA-binding MarR family transcriptional regulator